MPAAARGSPFGAQWRPDDDGLRVGLEALRRRLGACPIGGDPVEVTTSASAPIGRFNLVDEDGVIRDEETRARLAQAIDAIVAHVRLASCA